MRGSWAGGLAEVDRTLTYRHHRRISARPGKSQREYHLDRLVGARPRRRAQGEAIAAASGFDGFSTSPLKHHLYRQAFGVFWGVFRNCLKLVRTFAGD